MEDTNSTDGLSSIEAEFYTQDFIIRGNLTSPDFRLSDHLNSPTATFEVAPTDVRRTTSGPQISPSAANAYITKAHVLFVVPGRETASGSGEQPRSDTITHACVAGLGRYAVSGNLHTDSDLNPRLFLRSLEARQFVPLTDARVSFPDGTSRESRTVLVNRFHIELLAVDPHP